MKEYKYFNKHYNKRMDITAKKKKKILKKQEKALQHALDIRKFEIDLYWRRSAFFWAFIAAVYLAHFSLIRFFFAPDSNPNEVCFILNKIKCIPILCRIVLILTAALAFIFCHAWVLVNRASKFWQENWEAHVGKLENNIIGNLYDTFLNSECKKNNHFSSCPFSYKPYDFSVSTITTMVSMAVSVLSFLWMLILVFLSLNFPCKNGLCCFKTFSDGCFFLCREDVFSILLVSGFVIFVIAVCKMTVMVAGNKDSVRKFKMYKSRWKQRKNKVFKEHINC